MNHPLLVALLQYRAVFGGSGEGQEPKNRRINKLFAVRIPTRDVALGPTFRVNADSGQDQCGENSPKGDIPEFLLMHGSLDCSFSGGDRPRTRPDRCRWNRTRRW